MIRIEFSREFFARVLFTEPERLHFALITRTYNDSTLPCYHAAGLRVDGMQQVAFCFEEGAFIPLGQRSDSTLTMEDATIEAREDGYLFRTASGIEEHFTTCSLTAPWYWRVCNEQLAQREGKA